MTLELAHYPEKALAVRRGDSVVAATWFGPWVRRPYIYPFVGPGGAELTRLDHPGDPITHSHHKSIWISHHDVGGVDFWSDSPRSGRIVQNGLERTAEKGDAVEAVLELSWESASGPRILDETRRLRFIDLPGEELALEIDCELRAADGPVKVGVSNFGFIGVRVARTLRVAEGLGGLILNSQEAENEESCFAQHAVWCDYSGPVPGPAAGERHPGALPARVVGLALFDHPENAEDESLWHVRDDGWMGPSLTRREPREITPSRPLRVRYRLEAHAGRPWDAKIDERYREWRRSVR